MFIGDGLAFRRKQKNALGPLDFFMKKVGFDIYKLDEKICDAQDHVEKIKEVLKDLDVKLATLETGQDEQNGKLNDIKEGQGIQDGKIATLQADRISQADQIADLQEGQDIQDGRITDVQVVLYGENGANDEGLALDGEELALDLDNRGLIAYVEQLETLVFPNDDGTGLVDKVVDLEAKDMGLMDSVSGLQAQDLSLMTSVSQLQAKDMSLMDSLSGLEEQLVSINELIDALIAILTDFETEVLDRLEVLEEELIPMQCKSVNYNELSTARRYVTSDKNVMPPDIICDTTVTNVEGYDASTNTNDHGWVGDAWYRFIGDAGTQMPVEPPAHKKCGTSAPGWLATPLPTVEYATVPATYCFVSANGECTRHTFGQVTKCEDFYVYYLPNVATLNPMNLRCNLGYCGVIP